jgi:ferritin-like metal-binding protein YciE
LHALSAFTVTNAHPALMHKDAPMQTLNELFEETLKDVYFAEKAILKALPKMTKQASSEDLKAAFTEHAEQTEGQVERLDKIFKLLGKKAQGKECPALKGLVEETEGLIGEADRGPVLDAGLIGCAQAVEHYEIARYGTLCAWAEQLKMDEAVTLLEETLEEEEETDEKLSQLALSGNESADAGNDEEDDDEKEDKPAQRKRKAN